MQFELSEKDYQELRKIQKKKDLHPRRYRKVTVLILLHQGHSVSVIEAALGLDVLPPKKNRAIDLVKS